jgi:hypothetical protein
VAAITAATLFYYPLNAKKTPLMLAIVSYKPTRIIPAQLENQERCAAKDQP